MEFGSQESDHRWPQHRVTNKWGPRPPWRGRSANENDAAVATRHAASLLERPLGPAEAGDFSAAAASQWRRRRAAALRRKRGGRCRDAPPPPVPPADGQPPEPPDPSPSRRSPPSGGGAPAGATAAAVAWGCRPSAALHRPPLPARVVAHRVGGGSAAADGRLSDGRPSAAGKAGAPAALPKTQAALYVYGVLFFRCTRPHGPLVAIYSQLVRDCKNCIASHWGYARLNWECVRHLVAAGDGWV